MRKHRCAPRLIEDVLNLSRCALVGALQQSAASVRVERHAFVGIVLGRLAGSLDLAVRADEIATAILVVS